MTDTSAIRPVTVRAPRGARILEIDWEDGHTGIYPHRILRGFCPCAECQGHDGPVRYHEAGDLELVDIAEVGTYALGLSWGDGHATGIYSFRFLRALCSCAEHAPADPTDRTFARQ